MTETPPVSPPPIPPAPPEPLKDKLQRHYRAYRTWLADQPISHLAATMAIGSLLVSGIFTLLRVVLWMLGGLVDWLFIEDTPPPPPPQEVAEPPTPLEIAARQLGDYLADLVNRWAAEHAVAGIEPQLLVSMWLLIGAVLFLFALDYRGIAIAWAAWMLSTLWVVWDATPDGNPVPTALAAGFIAVLLCGLRLIGGLFSAVFR